MQRMGGLRTLTKRAIAALVLAALVAACSSGGDDDDRAERDRDEEQEETTERRARPSSDEAVEIAEAFVADYDALDDEGRDSLELIGTRRSPGVTHVRYRQVFDDVPVRAAQLVVSVDDDGEVLGAYDSLTDARPEPGVEQQVDEAEATDVAGKAVPDEVRRHDGRQRRLAPRRRGPAPGLVGRCRSRATPPTPCGSTP